MKVRMIDKSAYEIENFDIVNDHLEIYFKNTELTTEELQTIFKNQANTKMLEFLTDEDAVFSEQPDWIVYGGVILNGDDKTVILIKSVDITEQRLVEAESAALEAKIATEELKKEMISVDKEAVEASVLVAKVNAQNLSDTDAIKVKKIYDTWTELTSGDTTFVAEKEGFKFTHLDTLYKTKKANQEFQKQWVPGEGTESIFAVIDETHAGTKEDPIPYKVNMKVFENKYYTEDGILYLCTRDSGIELQNKASALVGHYFKVVE